MTDNYTRLPSSKVESSWVHITPKMAQNFLESNTENRIIRPKHVDRIVSDMKEDRFYLSHQGIAFDEQGKLVDGQHRLVAICESGKSQWMLVTIGLPESSRRVVDAGAKRRAHDFMPGKHGATRASAIRTLLAVQYCAGEFTIGSLHFALQEISSTAIQEAWYDWPHVEEFAPLAQEAARNVAVCGPSPLLAAALLYPESGKDFLVGLSTMTGLEPGDPRLALLKFRGKATRIQTPTSIFLAIKCAKAFAAGKQMSVLRYSTIEKLKV